MIFTRPSVRLFTCSTTGGRLHLRCLIASTLSVASPSRHSVDSFLWKKETAPLRRTVPTTFAMAPGVMWTKEVPSHRCGIAVGIEGLAVCVRSLGQDCDKLNELVERHGKKWTPIASFLGEGKTGKQVWMSASFALTDSEPSRWMS